MKTLRLHDARPAGRMAERAFTLIEIAISLGIIAFAMVAIIGVLPTGMSYQRENREETIINQDASIFLNAIRNGERGLDDLTNYVIAITNYATLYNNRGGVIQSEVRGYNYYGSSVTPQYPITNGFRIIGLMSTPRYTPTTRGYFSNYVVTFVRSMSGPVSEKYPQTNSSVQELGLNYRLVTSLVPYGTNWFDPSWTNYAGAANAGEFVTRSNYARLTSQYSSNLTDLRLLFRWPLLPNGDVPEKGSRQVYRALVSGALADTNEPGFSTVEHKLYFFQPRTYVQVHP